MTTEQLQQALAAYEPALMHAYGEQMRAKLGFFTPTAQDNDVLTGLLSLMAQEGRDYTRTFRLLSDTEQQQAQSPLRDEFIDRAAFDSSVSAVSSAFAAGAGERCGAATGDEGGEPAPDPAQLSGAAGH